MAKTTYTDLAKEVITKDVIEIENGVATLKDDAPAKVLAKFLEKQGISQEQFEASQVFASSVGGAFAEAAAPVIAEAFKKDKKLETVVGSVTIGKATSQFGYLRSKSYPNPKEPGTSITKKGVLQTLVTETNTERSKKSIAKVTASFFEGLSD